MSAPQKEFSKWHPIQDAIEPIAEALEGLSKAPTLDLWERVFSSSTWPSSELAGVFNASGLGLGSGSGSRREMLRRWLQTKGYAADAVEIDSRLQGVLEALRKFETEAREWPDEDGSRGLYDDACNTALSAADYLRQLAAMLRAAADSKGKANPKRPAVKRRRKPDKERRDEILATVRRCDSQAAAARELGISRARVSQIVRATKRIAQEAGRLSGQSVMADQTLPDTDLSDERGKSDKGELRRLRVKRF